MFVVRLFIFTSREISLMLLIIYKYDFDNFINGAKHMRYHDFYCNHLNIIY